MYAYIVTSLSSISTKANEIICNNKRIKILKKKKLSSWVTIIWQISISRIYIIIKSYQGQVNNHLHDFAKHTFCWCVCSTAQRDSSFSGIRYVICFAIVGQRMVLVWLNFPRIVSRFMLSIVKPVVAWWSSWLTALGRITQRQSIR